MPLKKEYKRLWSHEMEKDHSIFVNGEYRCKWLWSIDELNFIKIILNFREY